MVYPEDIQTQAGHHPDGHDLLGQGLRPYPVQLCQSHQALIIRHYLTQESELEASRELLNLVNYITRMDKESVKGRAFDEWYERNKDIINERVHDKRIMKRTPPYIHHMLCSAYLSIKRNMPLLWSAYDYPNIGLLMSILLDFTVILFYRPKCLIGPKSEW